jgi:hypothetical protein
MPLSGQTLGDYEVVTLDPAAGAELSWTATQDCIVHNIRFTLTTDATVASRIPVVRASDGTDIFFSVHSGTNHTASLAVPYSLFEGAVVLGNIVPALGTVMPLPTGGLRLRKNDVLSTLTAAIVAGDNYSTAVLRVEFL